MITIEALMAIEKDDWQGASQSCGCIRSASACRASSSPGPLYTFCLKGTSNLIISTRCPDVTEMLSG